MRLDQHLDELRDNADLDVLLYAQFARFGRLVRVRCSRLDRRLHRERFEERDDRRRHRVKHPGVREVDLMLLARVPLQVVKVRNVVRRPNGRERVLLEQVCLPLAPLHCLQTVAL
jgi:hypothetical protein